MKNAKEIKKLNTLQEIQEWCFSMMAKKETYIYRGQGDSNWKLNSLFARKSEDVFKDNKKSHFSYIQNYFIEKNKVLRKELENQDDLSLLGKMQHHGNPTPLIDFTEDIFVALWFGASYFPEMQKTHVEPKYFRIFYLQAKKSEQNSKLDISRITMDKIMILKFNTNQKIARSISQKSIFVFDNQNLVNQINYIDIKNDFDLKFSIISWLEKLGISSNSLFPDAEGIFKNFDFLSYEHFFMNGIKMSNSGKFDESEIEYEKASKINPNFIGTYINWGIVLSKKGEFDKAIKKLEKAIRMDPNNANAYYNLGTILMTNGKFDKAIENFKKVIQIDANNIGAYVNWGIVLSKKGEFDKAINKFEKAIQLDPNNTDIYNNLVIVLVEKGEFDAALTILQNIIKIDPNNIKAQNSILELKNK